MGLQTEDGHDFHVGETYSLSLRDPADCGSFASDEEDNAHACCSLLASPTASTASGSSYVAQLALTNAVEVEAEGESTFSFSFSNGEDFASHSFLVDATSLARDDGDASIDLDTGTGEAQLENSTVVKNLCRQLKTRKLYNEFQRQKKFEIYETALNEVHKIELELFYTVVEFEIPYSTWFGQNIYLVGDAHCLGKWDPEKALPMKWTAGEIWRIRVTIPRRVERVQYKYLVKEPNENLLWEEGCNHYMLVEGKSPKEVHFSHWDDRKVNYPDFDSHNLLVHRDSWGCGRPWAM